MTYIIDGKKQAALFLEQVLKKRKELFDKYALDVTLSVIVVGSDPASLVYIRNKTRKAAEIGIRSVVHSFPAETSELDLLAFVKELNGDRDVNGILVQLPLPKHITAQKVIDAIDYNKDVDGFSSYNVGLLNSWQESLEPCTPQGVMLLLRSVYSDLRGKKAVVLGRSRIVGRPMNSLLIKEGCTVTCLNSHSVDVKSECQKAEILVSAIGSPLFIKEDWVSPGACVIDVGIIKVGDKLCGNVDFENVKNVAGYLTPVPGGVGPMTVACLMSNTLKAACIQNNILCE